MADIVDADGPLLDGILDATYDLWNEGLTRQAYGRFYAAQCSTPWGRANLKRVALVDGSVVLASAKTYSLAGVLDSRPIRLVGIGAVFTPPARRGHGHARELLRHIVDGAARDGADVALLFSEIAPEYYARLGFEKLPTTDLFLDVAHPKNRGAPATLVRCGDDRDVADIAAMGRVRSEGYRFHLDRDRDWIQYSVAKKRLLAGLGPSGRREVLFFIAEEGASAVAYVVVTAHRAEWTIEECGDRDPAGARVGAILQVLLAREPVERRPAIHAWLPAGFQPPQTAIVDRRPPREVMMVRPLSPNGQAIVALEQAEILYWRGDLF